MTFGKRRNKTRESFVPDSSAVERAITSLERMLGDATVSGGSGEYGLLKMIVNEYRLTRSRLESVEGQLLDRIAELEADAERYRWLRESSQLVWTRGIAFAHYEKDAGDKAALDAGIDAARGCKG